MSDFAPFACHALLAWLAPVLVAWPLRVFASGPEPTVRPVLADAGSITATADSSSPWNLDGPAPHLIAHYLPWFETARPSVPVAAIMVGAPRHREAARIARQRLGYPF